MTLWPFIMVPHGLGRYDCHRRPIAGMTPVAVWRVVHGELVLFPYRMTFGVSDDLR